MLLLAVVGLVTVAGMALLWPRDTPEVESTPSTRVLGSVVSVTSAACPEEAPAGTACGSVAVRLDDGSSVTAEIPNGPGAPAVGPGDKVTLLVLDDGAGGPRTYSIADYQRGTSLWILGAVFALAVVAFGRWRGLTALLGLGITFAVLLLFIVPAILDGRSPVLVAVVGAAFIMLTVLYLTHGLTATTTVAVAGTLASLTLTAGLSALAIAFTHLSGIGDETATYLNITEGDVNMRGLLLAGIVIGSLGVLDDVTVTQSATVSELALANPAYGFRRLYGAATRIGRAHIASVINTIVLAYAGASLPLMLLFRTSGTPAGELLTGEMIAQELVRSAVGTIGLIAAVPITTALAAFIAARTQVVAPASSAPSAAEPPVAGRGPDRPPVSAPRPPGEDPWQSFYERDHR